MESIVPITEETDSYDEMEREELIEEARSRHLTFRGQPGEDKLREILREDDNKEATESGPEVVETPFDNTLSVDDIVNQYDPSVDMKGIGEKGRHPFAGYPVKLIKARYYPKNPAIDLMKKDELVQYCIKNEFFHKDWRITRQIVATDLDKHPKVTKVEMPNEWDADRIRRYIDSKETHTFPSHWIVFTNIAPRKKEVPHSLSIKSWITKRFRVVRFNLPWPLPTPQRPYDAGQPNKCTIVDDDSIRAQLFFKRQVKTGKVIPNMLGDTTTPAYFLLTGDYQQSSIILRNIFENGTRKSAALRQWEREGGIPEI